MELQVRFPRLPMRRISLLFFAFATVMLLAHWYKVGAHTKDDVETLCNGVKSHIAPHTRIGFVVAMGEGANVDSFYFQTQFFLAPAILNRDNAITDTVLVLNRGDFIVPKNVHSIGSSSINISCILGAGYNSNLTNLTLYCKTCK